MPWLRRHLWTNVNASLTIMRRVLVDYGRRRRYQKRGAGAVRVNLDDVTIASPVRPREIVALDEALQRLEQHDARKSTVVELRYFGGVTVDEIAQHLGVSPVTVKGDWSFAKVWLRRHIRHAADS